MHDPLGVYQAKLRKGSGGRGKRSKGKAAPSPLVKVPSAEWCAGYDAGYSVGYAEGYDDGRGRLPVRL